MKLGSDQVKKVAKLANLPINDDEVTRYSDQLSKILEYIDLLDKVDTQNTEPTFNVTGNTNIFQNDDIEPSFEQKDAVSNGKNKDELFIAKGVFSGE
jgi:aspartyl-tRNA(Asn)/glutamyl-tRNA(Gln) amidotransferase subunit C